jgi:hypothetical protein
MGGHHMTTMQRSASTLTDLGRPVVDPVAADQAAEPSADSDLVATTTAGVPWSTVLPMAAVLAYANGFWITAMRGAAGAIERSQGPTITWLRESTLALPLYVGAVILALMVAAHVVGPVIRSGRALLTSMLILAVGGTLAGAAAQASFEVQLKAVAIGSVLILITSLVTVTWVVAARGGRLDLTRTHVRPVKVLADGTAPRDRDRSDDLALVMAAALVGSAVIHAAVVPEHFDHWRLAAIFFLVLFAAELLLALVVVALRTRWVLWSVVVTSVVPLVLWTVSRSVGMPFGPTPAIPEAVGLADLAACALELVALVLAAIMLAGGRELGEAPVREHAVWLAVAAVVAITALGVGGTDVAPLTVDNGSGMSGMSTLKA